MARCTAIQRRHTKRSLHSRAAVEATLEVLHQLQQAKDLCRSSEHKSHAESYSTFTIIFKKVQSYKPIVWECQVRCAIADVLEITCPVHTDTSPPVKVGIASSKSAYAWPLTFYICQIQPTLMSATQTCNLHGTYMYTYNTVHYYVEC